MEKKLLNALKKEISIDRIREEAVELHRLEGNCSHSNFKKSTDYCLQLMRDIGFEKVERIDLKADGKTAYFDCIMPQAWEMKGHSWLRLEDPSIPENQRMIADSDEDPFTAGVWGAPTPKGGLDCEIVDFKNVDRNHPDIKGKMVLVVGQGGYKFIAENGAAGLIISDSLCSDDFPDNCRWSNAKSYCGWYPTAEDRRIPIFSITPRRAEFLQKRLERGPVKCHAVAESRIYDGKIYTVTGVIPGKSKEEVALVAHMYEPFVTDNTSGVAVILEICRSLKALVEQKKLPPLEKSIRVIVSMEWYGFSEYYTHPEKTRRILSLFSCDAVCNFTEKGKPGMVVRLSPTLAPIFMDFLLPDLFRRNLPDRLVTAQKGTLSDDTFCADAEVNIPAMWPHVVNYTWHHNTAPGFSEADWDIAQKFAWIMGTAVGMLSAGRKSDAAEIAKKTKKLAVEYLKTQIAGIRKELWEDKLPVYDAVGKVRYYADITEKRMMTINRFWPGTVRKSDTEIFHKMAKEALADVPVPKGPRPLHFAMKEASELVVRRLVGGPLCSLARVPHKVRTSSTVMPVPLYMILDGKRILFETIKLYEYEFNHLLTDAQYRKYIDHLRYLEKYGYVSIKKR